MGTQMEEARPKQSKYSKDENEHLGSMVAIYFDFVFN